MSPGPITRFPITLDVPTLERLRAAATAVGMTIPDFASQLVRDALSRRQPASPEDIAHLVAEHVRSLTQRNLSLPAAKRPRRRVRTRQDA